MSDASQAPAVTEPDATARRRALALVLALYVGWATAYLVANPWNGGVDEVLHKNYVQVIAEELRLPWIDAKGNRYRNAHAMHPPAYHLLLVPAYWASSWSEAVMRAVLRACSLALGALGLVLVFAVALRCFNDDLPSATAATGIVALMPLYLLAGSVVNNDIASVLVIALLLYLGCVRWRDDLTWRQVAVLGVVAGVAGLTKGTCEAAAIPAGAFLVVAGSRNFGRAGVWARLGIFIAIVVAFIGPWHLRNIATCGSFSYIPPDGKPVYLPVDEGMLVCMMHDNFPHVLLYVIGWQINTLWSQKDWIPASAQFGIYAALWSMLLVGGVLGLVSARLQPRRYDRRTWVAYLWSWIPVWLLALYIACFVHMGWAEGGRYLMSALPAVACVMCSGIPLLRGRYERLKWAVVAAILVAFVALNALCMHHLVTYLVPTYQPQL